MGPPPSPNSPSADPCPSTDPFERGDPRLGRNIPPSSRAPPPARRQTVGQSTHAALPSCQSDRGGDQRPPPGGDSSTTGRREGETSIQTGHLQLPDRSPCVGTQGSRQTLHPLKGKLGRRFGSRISPLLERRLSIQSDERRERGRSIRHLQENSPSHSDTQVRNACPRSRWKDGEGHTQAA